MPEAPESHRRLVADYLGLVETHSQETFVAARGMPVLLLEPRSDTAGPEFHTGAVSITELMARAAEATRQAAVVPVVKRSDSDNPYLSFIWVGREPGCDVVLPFEGVSKLHAQFKRGDGGSHTLLDVGSKNGTFLEGRPLEQGKSYPLTDNVTLRFGPIGARFRTPEGFWQLLVETRNELQGKR